MTCRPELRLLWLVAVAFSCGVEASAAPTNAGLADAAAALARGDGIAAEVAAESALRAGVPRSEVTALMGEAELLQGKLSDARNWLDPGEFSAATRVRGFRALGRLEMREGDLPAAAAAFDRALRSGADNARLWVDIARLRYLAGQHHLAVDAAAKAVALDPREPRALELQAQLIRDAQGMRAALPWFEHALAVAPDDIGLLGEYAATLGEAGRHQDMLRVARRMVELDPRHPRAYYLQAVLAARAGLDDLARRLLIRTRGAYDESSAGLLLAGVLDLRTGNAALAVERFDKLARWQPDNAEVRLLMGRALLMNGEANEVVARFGQAADGVDASPYLLALVGRAYEQLGNRRDAARYLDRAANASPATPGVLASHARSAFDEGAGAEVTRVRRTLAEGRMDEALRLVAALKRQYPHSIDVEILAGDVALLAGDPAAALVDYDRAALVRRDFALVERMAAAHRALGREDAAADVLTDYLAQNPRSAAAAAMLGRLLAERDAWWRARHLLEHARRLGGAADARLLADLAQAELAIGETGAAKNAAARAYRLQRANRHVAATLARVLAASGEERRQSEALFAKVRVPLQTELAQR